MPRPLQSAVDTAPLFDIEPETLRRLWRSGRIPGYKVGRYLRFDPDEVRDALRSGPPISPNGEMPGSDGV